MKGRLVAGIKMMLMRHGAAEDFEASSSDYNRHLTDKGITDVQEAVRQLQQLDNWMPGEIHYSPAMRTRETFQLVRKGLSYKGVSQEVGFFYTASAEQLTEHLLDTKHETRNLLLIGHNPAFSQLASYLAKESLAMNPADLILLTSSSESWVRAIYGPWAVEKHFKS